MQGNAQEMLYRSQINRAIAFILDHLADELRLDDIAGAAGFSAFHFHRIFSAFVGEPLGGYIRRLRLERSVYYLLHTAKTITEIAFDTGFASHAGYTKAFRQYYGSAPSTVRLQGLVPEKLEKENKIETKRRMNMKPRIKELPDQRVVYAEAKGLVGHSMTKAADRAFDALCSFLSHNHKWGQVSECLGICPDDPSTTPQEECSYLGGFILKPNAEIKTTEKVRVMILEGGKFAVFRHTGPYDNLWQTWNAIYRDWLPSSGLKLRDVPPYEVYLDDKHKTRLESLRTDIYIAIE